MEKGKTIFVIESGEYSDYRVVGIYSTRENAQKALAIMLTEEYSPDDAEISEWPLDQINQGLSPWQVRMRIDGNFASDELLTNIDVSAIESEKFTGRLLWKAKQKAIEAGYRKLFRAIVRT